jgi:hypothetical protein
VVAWEEGAKLAILRTTIPSINRLWTVINKDQLPVERDRVVLRAATSASWRATQRANDPILPVFVDVTMVLDQGLFRNLPTVRPTVPGQEDPLATRWKSDTIVAVIERLGTPI